MSQKPKILQLNPIFDEKLELLSPDRTAPQLSRLINNRNSQSLANLNPVNLGVSPRKLTDDNRMSSPKIKNN